MRPNNLDREEVIPQYMEAKKEEKIEQKEPDNELDLLYKNIGKAFIRPNSNKTPAVYFVVGFIAGVIFILLVFGIVAISSGNSKNIEEEVKPVEKVEQTTQNNQVKNKEEEILSEIAAAEEKYVIQKGDTIDKIVVKKYGQYSDEKINEILKINNISNPSKMQIGQVIILPSN